MSTALRLAMLDSRLARQAFKYGKNPFNTISTAYNRYGKGAQMALTGIDRLRAMSSANRGKRRGNRVSQSRKRNGTRKSIKNPYRSGRSAPRAGTRGSQMTTQSAVTMTVNAQNFRTVDFPQLNPATDAGRKSNNIFCSGIKVCCTFWNDALFDQELHIAFLRCINKEQIGTVELIADFFRDPTNLTQDREADFPAATAYSPALKCWNVNPSKYNILTHKRIFMGGKNSNIATMESGSTYKWERFYRINKRLQFESGTLTAPNNPFLVVAWFTPIDPVNFVTGATNMRWETMITPYYKL